jgi:hypothetical protein
MSEESQRFALRAAWEKLRFCYRARRRSNVQKESGAYGIRTRDLLNAIEALYQLS